LTVGIGSENPPPTPRAPRARSTQFSLFLFTRSILARHLLFGKWFTFLDQIRLPSGRAMLVKDLLSRGLKSRSGSFGTAIDFRLSRRCFRAAGRNLAGPTRGSTPFERIFRKISGSPRNPLIPKDSAAELFSAPPRRGRLLDF
jgi:hypothetical protein